MCRQSGTRIRPLLGIRKRALVSYLTAKGLPSCFDSSNSDKDIKLGVSKAFILEKYGQPFKEELYTEDGDTIEVLCYKEGLYASLNEHMVSTFFVFRNGKLERKEQTDELVKRNNE